MIREVPEAQIDQLSDRDRLTSDRNMVSNVSVLEAWDHIDQRVGPSLHVEYLESNSECHRERDMPGYVKINLQEKNNEGAIASNQRLPNRGQSAQIPTIDLN